MKEKLLFKPITITLSSALFIWNIPYYNVPFDDFLATLDIKICDLLHGKVGNLLDYMSVSKDNIFPDK